MLHESMQTRLTKIQKRSIIALVAGKSIRWPGTLKKQLLRKGLITPLQVPTFCGRRIAAKLVRIGDQPKVKMIRGRVNK